MASVAVILDWSEHMCCGEHRSVGDVVTITVGNYRGEVYEERHGEREGIEIRPVTGVITAIRFRPQIFLREGDYARRLVGYEPGFPVDSTDYDDPVVTEWAFEFTLETDDPMPSPRSV